MTVPFSAQYDNVGQVLHFGSWLSITTQGESRTSHLLAFIDSSWRCPMYRLLFLVSFILGGILATAIPRSDISKTVALLVVFGLLSISPVLANLTPYKKERRDAFSPMVFFPVFFFLVYGIGSILLILNNDENAKKIITLTFSGIIMYFLGNYAMSYVYARTALLKSTIIKWDKFRLFFCIYYIVLISTLSTIFLYYQAGIPILNPFARGEAFAQVTNYVVYLIRLLPLAFFLLLIHYFLSGYPGGFSRFSVVLLFVYSFFVLLSTGSRIDTFILIMVSIIIYHYTVRRLPLVKFGIASAILVILFLLYGYLRLILSAGTESEVAFLESLAGTNPFRKFLMYIAVYFSTYSLNFSRIIDLVPDVMPHSHGRLFLRTLSTLLPGQQPLTGYILSGYLGLRAGINPTMPGELYIDYGSPGVPIMMFIYGLIMRFFYCRIIRSPGCPTSVLIYSFCCYVIILSTLVGLFSHILAWYYAFFIILMIKFFGVRCYLPEGCKYEESISYWA